eukprot:CAMPEP_0201551478 /NCGR_PEP_ID=MMETSP0173_2-20130828/7651_1 /ASSEMBLY_ACC=CAM_ASM_000268 /TAXON_ID=218659 /ORGANISM="Vexillifera sp., Strain DIVA3 564/2" /LENGTH=429 /DNA_ID=CAMNT_0047961749 /DNA_START=233 /DNA_END=1518 /DNA_ORIENTATION=-
MTLSSLDDPMGMVTINLDEIDRRVISGEIALPFQKRYQIQKHFAYPKEEATGTVTLRISATKTVPLSRKVLEKRESLSSMLLSYIGHDRHRMMSDSSSDVPVAVLNEKDIKDVQHDWFRAVIKRDYEKVKMLLLQGNIDVNAQVIESPVRSKKHCIGNALTMAVINLDLRMLDFLLAQTIQAVDVNADTCIGTPLTVAIEKAGCCVPLIHRLLAHESIDVNRRTMAPIEDFRFNLTWYTTGTLGYAPLHLVASYMAPIVLELFLERRDLSVNIVGGVGLWTPLHIGIVSEQKHQVSLLLKNKFHKVDLNARSHEFSKQHKNGKYEFYPSETPLESALRVPYPLILMAVLRKATELSKESDNALQDVFEMDYAKCIEIARKKQYFSNIAILWAFHENKGDNWEHCIHDFHLVIQKHKSDLRRGNLKCLEK